MSRISSGAEGVAVRLGGVGEMGRRPADVAAQHQQVRLGVRGVGRVLERLADGGLEGIDVVGDLAQVVDAPAVGLEPLDRVVVVGQLGRPVDGDVVVVVEGEAGDRARDARRATPPRARRPPSCSRHPGSRRCGGRRPRDPNVVRSQRSARAMPTELAKPCPSGPVVTSMPAVWCISGCPGVRLPHCAELAQVLERQVVAGEMEHRVLQDARVPVREHEAVPVGPLGVLRVVVHDPGPQDVRQRSERHGGPGVARMGRLRRVHGDATDDVDAELDEPGVLHHRRRCLHRHVVTLTVRPRPLAGPSPTIHPSWLPACRCRQTATSRSG